MRKRPAALTLVLDQHSGSLRLSDPEAGAQLAGVSLQPWTVDLLSRCEVEGRSVRLLVIEPVAQRVLRELPVILPPIDEALPLSQPEDVPPPRGRGELLIAADRVHRQRAAASGYRVLPHPVMAVRDADDGWIFVALTGRRELFERLDVVPYWLERRESGEWLLLGAVPQDSLGGALALGLDVERLPIEVGTEDAVLVATPEPSDRTAFEGAAARRQHPLLWHNAGRALVALREGTPPEVPVHGVHGHIQALMPTPHLLDPVPPPAQQQFQILAAEWLNRRPRLAIESVERMPWWKLKAPVCPASATSFKADVDRFSGATPLNAGEPIVSRHAAHPDNARAVQALRDELRAIGYCPRLHPFSWSGSTRYNVIADLPGAGLFRFRPEVLEAIRKYLIREPRPLPMQRWPKGVRELVHDDLLRNSGLTAAPAWRIRLELERQVGLPSHVTWWLPCPLPGWGAEIVIVGCHLDSTAALDPGYSSASDPAAGTDDDASGVAATLALARWLWPLRGKLRHTVRFCFFNGEEQGLIGSKTYAASLKATAAPLRAAICMDMIGYNSDANRIFEVHAGYTDPVVRDASVPFAQAVASWAACLGALEPAQVYQGTSPTGGPDRLLTDGAINRSDHAAFHQQGYPAVVVTEDFFGNLASEPAADPNPNYHRKADLTIDAAYGADIVCAVGHAVRALAS